MYKLKSSLSCILYWKNSKLTAIFNFYSDKSTVFFYSRSSCWNFAYIVPNC